MAWIIIFSIHQNTSPFKQMKTFFKQQVLTAIPMSSQFYFYQLPYFAFWTPNSTHFTLPSVSDFQTSQSTKQQIEEPSTHNYQSKIKPSIILKAKTKKVAKMLKEPTHVSLQSKPKKDEKKISQKESRNVVSNLLRIFFKNILENRLYDSLIEKILARNRINSTREDFCKWLESFNINYKNYIRFIEVRKVLSCEDRAELRLVMRILLEQYIQGAGVVHCLTSKRIEHSSIKMHLEGLRLLKEQILMIEETR